MSKIIALRAQGYRGVGRGLPAGTLASRLRTGPTDEWLSERSAMTSAQRRSFRHHRPRALDAGPGPGVLPLRVLGLSDMDVLTTGLFVFLGLQRRTSFADVAETTSMT